MPSTAQQKPSANPLKVHKGGVFQTRASSTSRQVGGRVGGAFRTNRRVSVDNASVTYGLCCHSRRRCDGQGHRGLLKRLTGGGGGSSREGEAALNTHSKPTLEGMEWTQAKPERWAPGAGGTKTSLMCFMPPRVGLFGGACPPQRHPGHRRSCPHSAPGGRVGSPVATAWDTYL